MTWVLPVVGPVLATTLWYLAGSATLTKAIWSRYPPWLDTWVQCPACFGTWAAALAAMVLNLAYGWTFFGVDGLAGWALTALWGTYWVPLLGVRLYKDLISLHEGDHTE